MSRQDDSRPRRQRRLNIRAEAEPYPRNRTRATPRTAPAQTIIFSRYMPRDPLMQAQLDRKTLTEYAKKTHAFVQYYNEHNSKGLKLSLRKLEKFIPELNKQKRIAELDYLLAEYLSREWKRNPKQSVNFAGFTINGLIFFQPQLGGKLHRARKRVRGWSQAVPKKSHVAMPWPLAVLVAVTLVNQRKFDLGVGVLLAHHCMLRSKELVNIRASDLEFASQFSRQGGAGLRLGETKTGRNKFAKITSQPIIRLLRRLVEIRTAAAGPDARLISVGAQSLRLHFKQACDFLNFAHFKFSPHSLRGGGATALHDEGVSEDKIMQRGRWTQRKSLNTYLQSGRSVFIEYWQKRQSCPLQLSSTDPDYVADLMLTLHEQLSGR